MESKANGSRGKVIPFPKKAEAKPVSEFYVHAVLQAARAEALGLDRDAAKSWGLNRAIFYEAAKKGYIGGGGRKRPRGSSGGGGSFRRGGKNFGELHSVGRERAYAVRTPRGLRFVIGGKIQTPEAFDRQIKKRFPQWNAVWGEATLLMQKAPLFTLSSPGRFHEDIYKRWRARLAVDWPRGLRVLEEKKAKPATRAS